MQKKTPPLKLLVPLLTFLIIGGTAFAGRLPSTLAGSSLSNFSPSTLCAGNNYSNLPHSDCNTNTPDPSPGSCQLAWMNGGGGTVALDVSNIGDDQGLQSTLKDCNLRCAADVNASSCTLIPGANSGNTNLDLANVMNRSPWIYQQLASGQFGLNCNSNTGSIINPNGLMNVPLNSYNSFQVTTPGYTDRYLRHMDSLGYTEVVNSGSSTLLKQDATFEIVPGLVPGSVDKSCYSFESRNYRGQYLRHFDYRIRKDPNDGSMLFQEDATFCKQPGLSGTGVSFYSYNYPDRYIRHINAEVWISSNGGPNAWDNPDSYVQDVSWNIVAPWERNHRRR